MTGAGAMGWVLAGAGLGGVFVRRAAGGGAARERRVLALGLVVAAALYPAFVLTGVGGGPFLLEVAGVTAFAVPAWAGVVISPVFLAVGWAAHVGWDVGLHLVGPAHGPGWYAALCIGFDLVVVAAVLARRGILLEQSTRASVVTG